MTFSIIYSTAGSLKEARKIANVLIRNKLVACINAFPVSSFYKWKGKFCNEKEIALIIKTKKENVEKVMEKIKNIHSYDLPCIISWDINKGNKEFLQWMSGELK